jgi:hypothetical protein
MKIKCINCNHILNENIECKCYFTITRFIFNDKKFAIDFEGFKFNLYLYNNNKLNLIYTSKFGLGDLKELESVLNNFIFI